MQAVQPAIFSARWTEQNRVLRERNIFDCSASEIIRVAFTEDTFWFNYFLKDLVRPVLGRTIVPAANMPLEMRARVQRAWAYAWEVSEEPWRLHYRPEPIIVRTPDNVLIRGTFYRSTRTQENDIPTLIVSQPNAAMQKAGAVDWILEKGADQRLAPFHLVAYDYRGVGESESVPLFAKQLALDGESIHQCVFERFQISENNIRHFGRSLGGAVSALVRQIHASNAPYVNSHSFSSLTAWVEDTDFIHKFVHGSPEHQDEMPVGLHSFIEEIGLPGWLVSLLQAILSVEFFQEWGRWLLEICGWGFDEVSPALQAIGENALVIYDPEDPLIQHAGAYTSVAEEQRLAVTTSRPVANHHNAAPELLIDGHGAPVTDKMLTYLLS